MASAKTNQNVKRIRKMEKRATIDKATNWFMINLAWGILAIIILSGIQNKLLINPKAAFTPTIIFAVLAVGLYVCSKAIKALKNPKRFFNYAVFSLVIAVVSLYIGLFPQIRNIAGTLFPSILNLDSRVWITRGPITLIAVYLVVAFVLTAIKIAKVEKK